MTGLGTRQVGKQDAQLAARVLRVYMSYLSEQIWCAGWQSGLEYVLWDWVTFVRAPDKDKVPEFPWCMEDWTAHAEVLSWLSSQAAGWWVWEECSDGPEFVSEERWRDMSIPSLRE